jgi:hypothetical protein
MIVLTYRASVQEQQHSSDYYYKDPFQLKSGAPHRRKIQESTQLRFFVVTHANLYNVSGNLAFITSKCNHFRSYALITFSSTKSLPFEVNLT